MGIRYLLDTNACITHLNSPTLSSVTRRLARIDSQNVFLCSVVKAELIYGALRSRDPAGSIAKLNQFFSLFTSIPFDDHAADEYGRIRADLAAQGTPIGPNDLMIAAIARANDFVLVTHNISEFRRVAGLTTEDWEQ